MEPSIGGQCWHIGAGGHRECADAGHGPGNCSQPCMLLTGTHGCRGTQPWALGRTNHLWAPRPSLVLYSLQETSFLAERLLTQPLSSLLQSQKAVVSTQDLVPVP